MANSGKKPSVAPQKAIALVGMMGVGKTTIGRRLAPRLGLPFFDADAEIEKAAGMSVAELFRLHGEGSFREGEARVIGRLLDGPPIVLATGGGALTTALTRERIRREALSIWIKADTDTIIRRATRRGTRPLLKTGDPRQTIERLMRERAPFYEAADIHIESQPGPHANTVAVILDALARHEARPGEAPCAGERQAADHGANGNDAS